MRRDNSRNSREECETLRCDNCDARRVRAVNNRNKFYEKLFSLNTFQHIGFYVIIGIIKKSN